MGLFGFVAVTATAMAGTAVHCGTDAAALKDMLENEYAFAQQAGSGVRAAFLEYLAEDSLVLEPAPVPGRAFYAAAKDDAGSLEWYPELADLAGSDDLGFTTGPWVYKIGPGGTRIHGHFLTIWKRDAACRWRVELDGGVSHAVSTIIEPRLAPETSAYTTRSTPPLKLMAGDAVSHAISEFQDTARQDGFAAGIRTYARDTGFRLYVDGVAPMGLAAANGYFTTHAIAGAWKEDARGRSADSSLAYSVGELSDANQRSSHSYVQIWQYDPHVANWGLRILLINDLAPPTSK
jgi:ketosteroid isomerase-like protein